VSATQETTNGHPFSRRAKDRDPVLWIHPEVLFRSWTRVHFRIREAFAARRAATTTAA